jgi:hypothetical protein
MDLPQFLKRRTFGSEPPRAPRALLYVPPSGAPVNCADVESAQAAAENYAAEHPGRTVAVYQLVGYAFRPIEKPSFTPAESDKAKGELLDVVPATVEFGEADGGHEIDRPDLSPQQRETLDRLRAASRERSDGE